jgi:arylsulfatase A-like enzyme
VIVRSVDDELGRLFKALERRGMLKDTMVVITADHGEEFGEHGQRFHGRTLYEEMVHVPLIIYSPAYSPREVDEVISHLDVAPTLLSHLALKDELRFLGVDWDQFLRRGRSYQDRAALFEVLPDSNYGIHLVGTRRGDEKLIYHAQSGALERFDLDQDPAERDPLSPDLIAQRSGEQSVASLARHLMRYVEVQLYQLSRGQSGAKYPRKR